MNRKVETDQSLTGDTPSAAKVGDMGADEDVAGATIPAASMSETPGTGPATPDRNTPPTKGGAGNVGNLLRGAYRQTVDEAIPDDLMDLLNKLE